MATSGIEISCDVCQQQDLTEAATYWCRQCEQGLCNACKKVHAFLKVTKHHSVITVEDHNQLPSSVVAGKCTCSEHDLPYNLYCKKHEQPCCSACLKEKHAQCAGADIETFANAVKNIKSSAKFGRTEKKVVDLHSYCESVESFCKDTIQHIDKEVETCKHKFKDVRNKLIDHLDTLEGKLIETLQDGSDKNKRNTNNVLTEIQNKKKNVQYMKETFEKLKLFSTEQQTFFAISEIDKECIGHELFLDEILKNDKISRPNFSLDMSNIEYVIQELSDIGTLNTKTNFFTSSLNVLKKNEAQLHVVNRRPKSINDFQLNLKHNFSLQSQVGSFLNSGVITPSGDLLLVSYDTKKLISCKPDGTGFQTLKHFDNSPVDICLGENVTSVIVGFNEDTAEALQVNLETRLTTSLGQNAYGVYYHNGYIYGARVRNKSLWRLDSKSKSILETVCLKLPLFNFNISAKTIVCSHLGDQYVAAYNCEGRLIWNFSHNKLKGPYGVTTTSDGYVFVACRNSNNVWLFSIDGSKSKIILENEDGLNQPRGVHFDEDRKELIVTCDYLGDVFLYSVDW